MQASQQCSRDFKQASAGLSVPCLETCPLAAAGLSKAREVSSRTKPQAGLRVFWRLQAAFSSAQEAADYDRAHRNAPAGG